MEFNGIIVTRRGREKGKGKEKGGNKQKNGARAAKQEKEEDGNRG